ncbi:MAG: Holliday junction resolvase RuvX [Verrucomicrobia bacterium]|nr:Holliday junction resolvase RuvX [Verrucomicrobiota bacterium]
MRILALDHGTVRIGVALSDELKMFATPLEFIAAEPFPAFLERLKQLLREKEVELILVGMPRNMDGSYGPAALKVQEFVAVLKGAVTVPIRTVDERLTSVQAQKFLREGGKSAKQQRGKVDQAAAALLLQGYLDNLA